MKTIHKILMLAAFSVLLFACADNTLLDYAVKKPESIAIAEYLNNYDVLKAYVNRTDNPKFKLGAGANLSEYVSKGLVYQMLNSNFDEIAMGWEMKHGAVVQNDGTLDLANVQQLLEAAQGAGMGVYGHTLVWHANQNANYLNGLIAPTVIPGESTGPTWEVVAEQDFETDDASNYEYNSNAIVSFTADGEGADGTGRAIKIVNEEVRENDWNSQFFLKFSPPMQEGERYILRMDVRSDDPASFSTQAHTVPYAYKHWDFFGSISSTPTWSEFVKEITVSADVATTGTIAFNLGNHATTYYLDNIKLEKYNESGGGAVPTDAGYAMMLTNPQQQNFWEAQVGTDVGALKNGKKYKLSFWGKADKNATLTAEVQTPSGSYPSTTFGSFTLGTEWTEVNLSLTVDADDRTRFLYNFGQYVGTIYLDNIVLVEDGSTINLIGNSDFEGGTTGGWNGAWNGIASIGISPEGKGFGGMGSSDTIIPKTDEEKRELIDGALESWIAGMFEVTKGHVKAWDVVNEPMSDWPDPKMLKTGVGKENMATDEFYWQDYLGKDYAVRAIQLARQYGNPDDLLFINDYGLEGKDQRKCEGLIAYVEYVESKGVTVDGIGTQMHVTCGITDIDGVKAMFENLAATGKLIKISELDMGYRPEGGTENLKTDQLTLEQHKEMAEFYQEIVQAYFELIPAAQRYGITQWAPTDSPAGSAWRPNEPIGLWTLDYNRKHAYGGFANGLAGKILFKPSN